VYGSKLIFTELFSIQWTVTWWSHLSNTKNIKKRHENTPACALHSKWYNSFVWQTDQNFSHYPLPLSFKSNMVHQVGHQWCPFLT